jgi:hypothetical protein
MKEPVTNQMKEEPNSNLQVIDLGTLTTLKTFARTSWRKMMVNLDRLAPHQGTTQDEWP